MQSHPSAARLPLIAPADRPFDPALAPAFVASPAVERLQEAGALAVTTGQQPGLFGGALYTVHKAMAARGLALELERRWRRPVVPVFWMAGDDHDWTEATQAAWWSRDGEAVTSWALPARDADAAQLPMVNAPLPADITVAREALAAALPEGDDRDRTLAWIDRHWRPGASVHGAYAASLAELLAPWGIACFDATHEAVKRAQRPLITAGLEQATELDRALAELPDPGTGIAAGEGATLVFLTTDTGRDRLMVEGGGFRTRRGGESFSREDLLGLLEASPERFSANVLLRPVVEAALLPTVAYLAGPGEHRYLTRQAAALYPMLEVAPQAVVPRWGGTVIDGVAARLLGRLDVTAEAVINDDGSLGRSVLRGDLPPAVPEAIGRLATTIDAAAETLTVEGIALDPVLERAVASRHHRLLRVVEDLERLFERHLKKRDGIAFAQYRRLRVRLMPLDRPQERVISVAAALGRWGDAWLTSAAAAAAAWARDALVAHDGDS
jgi:bacillithiol biosynthesis cysteine-adding enzyme BshC